MINSMSDLTNAPTAIPMGDKFVTVKKLSINEIWTIAEKGVTDEKFSEAAQLASGMKLTSGEKVSFMQNVLRDMPKGKALQKAAQDWLGTPTGIGAVVTLSTRKVNPAITEPEIAEILKQGTPDQLITLAAWCTGADMEEVKKEMDADKKAEADPKVKKAD